MDCKSCGEHFSNVRSRIRHNCMGNVKNRSKKCVFCQKIIAHGHLRRHHKVCKKKIEKRRKKRWEKESNLGEEYYYMHDFSIDLKKSLLSQCTGYAEEKERKKNFPSSQILSLLHQIVIEYKK